jgi:ATP-binding cassette subfamily B protein
LFDPSISNNISHGRPQQDFCEIIAAAFQGELHDFISTLPGGYKTVLGQYG